ncbi:MAG: LPS O-antigen length regulator, partial [Kangiellaceae bacterium]|nr:LPS O-antigen length regulator [Kangiellaceae bacterium]
AQVKALSTLNPALYSGIENADDEIDLKELWQAIWAGKWMVVFITTLFAMGAVAYALSIAPEYKSTAILSPVSSSSANSLSKIAGQFGGLASLAGINLGGATDDKSVIAMQVMKTWGFIEKFIVNNSLQVDLYAVNGWTRKSNRLSYDQDIYDIENKVWTREYDKNKSDSPQPTSWELYQLFAERVEVTQDKNTGLVTVGVSFYSPILAKQWVDKLVRDINEHVKQQDKDEAIRSIAYLEEQISLTNVAEMKSVFYQLIEQQSKTLMLTEISDEYVFKTISPAKVAEERFKPKRAVIVILGTLLGGFLAVVIVVLLSLVRKQR